MKTTSTNVFNQSEIIQETYSKFTSLDKDIDSTIDGISNIKNMIENISINVVAIVDIISNLSAISEENTAIVEQTMSNIEEQTASIEEIFEKAVMLENIASVLMQEVNIFKTK